MIWFMRYLTREKWIPPKPSLRDFTDKELTDRLNNNDSLQAIELASYCSEILRRMNNNKDLLPEKKWEHKGPLY